MQRNRPEREDDREREQRVAPAVYVDQRLGERQEDEAREPSASVIAVIARRRSTERGNHFASTVKAGS